MLSRFLNNFVSFCNVSSFWIIDCFVGKSRNEMKRKSWLSELSLRKVKQVRSVSFPVFPPQGPTAKHIQLVMERLLRRINRTVIGMSRQSPHIVSVVQGPTRPLQPSPPTQWGALGTSDLGPNSRRPLPSQFLDCTVCWVALELNGASNFTASLDE